MASDLDVALVHHPTSNPHRPILLHAMGLLGIADHLHRNGIRAQVVNLGVELRVDARFDVLDYLSRTGVRVVGLSVGWFFQLPDSLELARAIKEALPHVYVVMGGFSASFFAEDIVRGHPHVDAVVKGDGELPMLELCRHRIRGGTKDLHELPNLVFRVDGGVHATPFSHAVSRDELARVRIANMSLLKNREAFFGLAYYPTHRFKDRIDLRGGGLLVLEAGRGCPYSCVFCGGAREAQRKINNRARAVFMPIDAVMANIHQAMEHGYKNFYVCFDPVPNGSYYFDLFERIRAQKLDLGLIFGCWDLPSPEFIDAFAETFPGGLLEISPETADDDLRRQSKGPLGFTNAELQQRLAHMARRDVACQLFYGFFLPGDTDQTVRRTLQAVHDLDGPLCETFYLAFSTDPGSPLQSNPDAHDIETSVHTLEDYLLALGKKRLSPNLLAHRPRSLPADEATRLELLVVVDQLLFRIFPATLRLLRLGLDDDERFRAVFDHWCSALVLEAEAREMDLDIARVVAVLSAEASGPEHPPPLRELIGYEATPYLLMDRNFRRVGMHYSWHCDEADLAGEALAAFRDRQDTVEEIRSYRHDVKRLRKALLDRGAVGRHAGETRIGFVLDRSGKFATYYAPRD